MRFKKVLFVIPWQGKPGLGEMPDYPHTGVGYLSAYLLKNNVDNEVLDMRLGYSIDDLLERIEIYKPDLIGFNVMTYRVNVAYDYMKIIKEKYSLPIIVGGPHATTYRKELFKEGPMDYLIKFEGERTLLELCKGKDETTIDGLIYKKENNVIENPDRPFISDLDSIPFPQYEKFEIDKYAYSYSYGGKGIPIVSSRGCPYKCNFCSVKDVIGSKFRVRSEKSIMKEMKYWYARGTRNFFFVDDNFTMWKERILSLCQLIKEEGMNDLTLSVPQGVRADKLDYELLKRMRDSGFWFLSFGVESAKNRILEEIGKHETVQQIERAIGLAVDLGYEIGLFFIIGHPSETPIEFDDSLRLAARYPVSAVFFYHAIPYPKTELYYWAQKNNLLGSDFDRKMVDFNSHNYKHNQPFFETPHFTAKQRKEAYEKAKKVERFVKKKSMERKLKSKYGLFGQILTNIMYNGFLYRKIQKLYYFKVSRKIIDFIINKFNLKIHQF